MKTVQIMRLSFIRQLLQGLVASMAFATIACANGMAKESPIYTKIVEDGVYVDTLSAVKETIQSRGINIAHTSPPKDVLERTAAAFGITEHVLKEGEIVEFCSMKISHELVKANPLNVTLCPFALTVYVLNSDPGNVRISYRKPFIIDESSRDAVDDLNELYLGIIEEAAAW